MRCSISAVPTGPRYGSPAMPMVASSLSHFDWRLASAGSMGRM